MIFKSFQIKQIHDQMYELYNITRGKFEGEKLFSLCKTDGWPNISTGSKMSNWKNWIKFKKYAHDHDIENAWDIFKNNGCQII